jgi:response regulator RpfG family c-di-GMP phosphodiesterase
LDALNSYRPYRAAWHEEKAYENLLGSLGTHFDPKVVDEFMHLANKLSTA